MKLNIFDKILENQLHNRTARKTLDFSMKLQSYCAFILPIEKLPISVFVKFLTECFIRSGGSVCN